MVLEKYAEHGITQFALDVLKVPPLSNFGMVGEIARLFGGADRLKLAVEQMQTLLHVA